MDIFDALIADDLEDSANDALASEVPTQGALHYIRARQGVKTDASEFKGKRTLSAEELPDAQPASTITHERLAHPS